MSASPDGGSPNGQPRGAAFFDLDKTLMAGSSGIFFARAAYETGMISRGRLVRDVYENLRFRLRGSTDDRADDVRRRVGEMIAGVRVRDLERLSPRVLAGVLPRLYPQMLERAYAHQDAGLPVYILTAASQEMADLLAHVLAFDGGLGSRSEIVDGRYTGRPAGPFNYREGKVLSMREVAERERHRPGRLLRVLGLGVRPADAARGGPRGRRQPRRGAAADRARGGLGGDRARPPRPAPEGARRARAPAPRSRRSGGRRARAQRRARARRRALAARRRGAQCAARPPAPRDREPSSPLLRRCPAIARQHATQSKIRVVVAKPGLDGHDRGAKIIARALRDAGMEVIYTGLHQTPEQIVETVIQEDADAVGLSILSGAHMTLVPRVVELLREQGVDDVVITVGGTIPAEDIPELKSLGVAEVFTPGAPTQAIVDFIRGAAVGALAEPD